MLANWFIRGECVAKERLNAEKKKYLEVENLKLDLKVGDGKINLKTPPQYAGVGKLSLYLSL